MIQFDFHLACKMTKSYLVRRYTPLYFYLLWAFPMKDFIGQHRSREAILHAVLFALKKETISWFRDNEIIMCRDTYFERFFNRSHVNPKLISGIIAPHVFHSFNPDMLTDCSDSELEDDFGFSYDDYDMESIPSQDSDEGYSSD